MRAKEPMLSVVVPTRNERENIPVLLDALCDALPGVVTEVLIVDDSDDDTPEIARAFAGNEAFVVRVHHREAGPARSGGLATAVSEGMALAKATYVAVIDADLQHPPERLRALFDEAVAQDADVVMATRYRAGGSYEGLDGPSRRFFSIGLKWMAKVIFPDQLLRVSDPLGGFFLVRRSIIEGVKLRPIGYKISLELLVRCRWDRLVEVPYQFHTRAAGESKANFMQGVMVLQHMWRLIREVPAAGRFWKFCAVGASGVVVNFLVFALARHEHVQAPISLVLATESSILSNFILNSVLTWRDMPSRRRREWFSRALRYHMAVLPSIALYLALFASLSRFNEPTSVLQAISLFPSLVLSYFLARRVFFVPRDSWSGPFPAASMESIEGEATDREAQRASIPAPGYPQAQR